MRLTNLFISLILASTLFLNLSCSSDDFEEEVSWDGDGYAPAEGGTINIYFSTNKDWTAFTTGDLVEITPKSGKAGKNYITATYEENQSTTRERSSCVHIVSKDKYLFECYIGQKIAKLSLSKKEIEFGQQPSEEAIDVNSISATIDDIIINESSKSWLNAVVIYGNTISDNGGRQFSIKITATRNESTDARNGTITIKAVDYERQVYVTQKGVE